MQTQRFPGFEKFPGLSFQEGGHCESWRVASFKEWHENHPISAIKLAKTGFVYKGQADEVGCNFCGFSKRDWVQEDKPEDVHRANSPGCPIFDDSDHNPNPLVGLPNIPIPAASVRNSGLILIEPARDYLESAGLVENGGTQPVSEDHEDVDVRAESVRRDIGVVLRDRSLRGRHQALQALGITERHGRSGVRESPSARAAEPVGALQAADGRMAVPFTAGSGLSAVVCYPGYSSPEKRQRTFTGNSFRVQGVSILRFVNVGFFCAGQADLTICFCCGLMLHDWHPGDDPAFGHARHKPSCRHLIQVMGNDFIRRVLCELTNMGYAR